jgi:caspase-1
MGHDVTDSYAMYYRIPTWADFLITYSTIPGYFSWRNTLEGSWFIQSLVKILNQEGSTTSLLDLLTKVSYNVAYNYESNVPDLSTFHKQKQVPVIHSMLTRKIIFKPKVSKDKQ